ncbi:MAG: flagellar hook protein FlgE [Magnetospiraceae bacterium]
MLTAALSTSTLAMVAQSNAMETISLNIANINTGGYKRADTQFSTILGKTLDNQSDIGGVVDFTRTAVDRQGTLVATDSIWDLAVSGHGMFIFNSELDQSGTTYYGRDGTFHQGLNANGEGYLVDKNENYLLAYPVDGQGNIGTTLEPVRVDIDYYALPGVPTTAATLLANIPANESTAQSLVSAYDSSGTEQGVTLNWQQTGAPNTWTVTTSAANGTITSPGATTVTFDEYGDIVSPTSLNITGTFPTGNVNYTLDLSGLTQLNGSYSVVDYSFNGSVPATLQGFEFDASGNLIGKFDNATARVYYRIPVANFRNPNGLNQLNGNIFEETEYSGPPRISNATTASSLQFLPFTREISNVSLEDEFSRMIITQRAYSTAATAFRTADEMTETVRDLI